MLSLSVSLRALIIPIARCKLISLLITSSPHSIMNIPGLAAASLFASTSCATSLTALQSRQGSFYPIIGAIGGVKPRLEIRQLEKAGEMWNLFLPRMAEFEAMNQNAIHFYCSRNAMV